MSENSSSIHDTTDIVCFVSDDADTHESELLKQKFEVRPLCELPDIKTCEPILMLERNVLSLVRNAQVLSGDLTKMLRRVDRSNLGRELLVKAAKIKNSEANLTAADATAGLGEDAFLLAAAGFSVKLYERDPVIAALLRNSLCRAAAFSSIADIVKRMELIEADSLTALPELSPPPDVILLDPMFPSRRKSGLVKKKFQLLQQLEKPCTDGEQLVSAAISCRPRKIIIKRPADAPFLGGHKPSYSLKGSTIRYDCIVLSPET